MRFVIPADHPCLAGHFPGRPVVPGVVVLEQVITAIERQHGPLPALQMPQVKFVQPLLPEQPADIVLQGQAPCWRFQVLGADRLLASGEIVATPPVTP